MSIAQDTVRLFSGFKYSFYLCTSYLSFSNHLLHIQASPTAQCYSRNYKFSNTSPNPESAPPPEMVTQTLPGAGVTTPEHTWVFPSEEIMDRCGCALHKLIFKNYLKLLLEGRLHHLSNEFRLQHSPHLFQILPYTTPDKSSWGY